MDARFTNYTNWDDLRFPSQGINPPGAVADPDVDTATGLWLFDKAATEVLAGVAQMPHTWLEGSAIYPHIHWAPSGAGAGNVLWRFSYEIVESGDVISGTYTAVDTLGAAVDQKVAITSFGPIAMTGKQISTLILWKLARVGGDGTDTYDADAILIELDFHYQVDSLGSGEMTNKIYVTEQV